MNRDNNLAKIVRNDSISFLKFEKYNLQTPIRTIPAFITIRKHHYSVRILKFVPAPVKKKEIELFTFLEGGK